MTACVAGERNERRPVRCTAVARGAPSVPRQHLDPRQVARRLGRPRRRRGALVPRQHRSDERDGGHRPQFRAVSSRSRALRSGRVRGRRSARAAARHPRQPAGARLHPSRRPQPRIDAHDATAPLRCFLRRRQRRLRRRWGHDSDELAEICHATPAIHREVSPSHARTARVPRSGWCRRLCHRRRVVRSRLPPTPRRRTRGATSRSRPRVDRSTRCAG